MHKLIIIFTLIVVFTTLSTFTVFPNTVSKADISSKDQLTIDFCSITNGDAEVPINPTIQLTFSKNIVSLSVVFENSNCFHLVDSSGFIVPISVIFPDEQLQSIYKNQVFIIPQQTLKNNSVYSLIVDNTLKAKNGDRIDNAHILIFSTSDKETKEVNSTLSKLGDNILTFDTALELTEASNPNSIDNKISTLDSEVVLKSTNAVLPIMIVLVALGVLTFVVIIIIKGKNKLH